MDSSIYYYGFLDIHFVHVAFINPCLLLSMSVVLCYLY